MTIYAGCLLGLAIAYLVLILYYISHWNKLPPTSLPVSYIGTTSITVIIPIRNEDKSIKQLLESILANKYPSKLLEIIVVDDHSVDKSVGLIKSLRDSRIKILSLSEFELPKKFNSFKKFGIEEAVKMAGSELIITTDGDCLVPINWLNYYAYAFEKKDTSFIAAPVNFHIDNNNLMAFQSLDFMGMMLITGANIQRGQSLMCNGANMGYSKALFLDINGYAGISEHASGDDVMLLNKVASKTDYKIGFIKNKEATVHTHATPDWNQFVKQRLRWATKNSSSSDLGMKLELGIVYLLCCGLILLPLVFFFLEGRLEFVCILACFIKFITDYILLYKAATFFGKKEELFKNYVVSSFIHIGYIVYIGTLSLFKKQYEWKGRTVN